MGPVSQTKLPNIGTNGTRNIKRTWANTQEDPNMFGQNDKRGWLNIKWDPFHRPGKIFKQDLK